MADRGPGGHEVGRISIRVLPDTSAFGRSLERYLTRVETRLRVQIPAEIDTRHLAEDIARVEQEARAAATAVRIPIQADPASVKTSLAEVEAAAKATGGIEIPVALKDGFAERIRRQVAVAAKAAEVNIPLDAQGEDLRRKLAAAVAAVEASLKVHIPVDLGDAAEFRRKVAEQVAEVEAIAKSLHPQVDLDVKVDRKGELHKRLNAAGNDARRLFRGFGDIVGVAPKLEGLQRVMAQVGFLTARAAASALLFGPPILLVAAGAAAIAPALAVALPVLLAIAAVAAVVALSFDSIFGAKAKKKGGKRTGGLFDDLRQQISGLKGQVGSLLTDGLQPMIHTLATAQFPGFATGLKNLAFVMNGVIKQVLTFASSVQAVGSTKAIFAGIAEAVAIIGQAIQPFLRAMLEITVAALPGMHLLAVAIAAAVAQFSSFIHAAALSGSLSDTITRATRDLLGFVGAALQITGELLHLLVTLEPAARATAAAIGSLLSTVITGLDQAVNGFTLSDSIFRPVLDGMVKVVVAAHDLPQQIIAAFAPLVTNQAFGQFVANAGRLVVNLATLMVQLTRSVTAVVEAFNLAFGPPVLLALSAVAAGLANTTAFLSQHQAVLTALAAIYVGRYVPALVTAVLWNARFAAAVAGAAVRAAIAGTAAAVGALATSIGAAVAGMRAFGVSIALGAAVSSIGTAATTAAAALKGLAASLLSVEAIATAGFVIAFVGLIQGLSDIKKAEADAQASTEEFTRSFNALDQTGAEKMIAQLRAVAQHSVDVGKNVGRMTLGWDAFVHAVTLGAVDSKFEGIAAKGQAAAQAMGELQTKLNNTNINLSAVSKTTGATVQQLRQLAGAKGIDLSKSFADSAPARQQLVADLKQIEVETGLSATALTKAVGPSTAAWQKLADAIKPALEATDQAFKQQTDVLGNYAQGTTKAGTSVTKATEGLTKAKQRLGEAEARVSAKQKRTISDTQTLAHAQQRVAEADNKLAKARAGQASSSLEAQYRTTIAQATRFARDITQATVRGVDPTIISKLLQEGPQKAEPVLRALLSDHSNHLIDMANTSEKTLATINAQVVEQARITNTALHASNDQYTRDLSNALRIAQVIASSGGAATSAALVKALHIDKGSVQRIAEEFGLNVTDTVQHAVSGKTVNVKVGAKVVVLDIEGLGAAIPVNSGPHKRQAFAYGGLVKGPGTTRSDSIAAPWLSNREFVHQAPAVSLYGTDVMTAINRMAIPPDVLRAVVRSPSSTALALKLARVGGVARAHARTAVPAIPGPVRASLPRWEARPEAPETSTGPRSMVVVDADGVLRGQMRIATTRHHRAKRQAKRLAALGTWGTEP